MYHAGAVTWAQPTNGTEAPGECRTTNGGELTGHGLCATAEGALASFPIGDLRPWLPRHLERMIYEDTPAGQARPMAAHDNLGLPARHMRPELIARRAGCSKREAANLADVFVALDASERMAAHYCARVREHGAAEVMKQLEPLARAAAEAEACDPEDAIGQGGPDDGYGGETVAYHRLWDDGEEDWVARHPESAALWERARAEKDPAAVAAARKRLYDAGHEFGTAAERGFAWAVLTAAARRLRLRAEKCKPKLARALQARIAAAKSAKELSAAGQAMYALQTGKAKTTANLAPYWNELWQAYKARKEALA